MKKIVIKVLMLTVLLSVSVSSYAYDFEVDGIYYNKIDGGLEVANGPHVLDYDGKISIPQEVNGMSVIAIGDDAFNERTDLVEVTIPNTVERIGDRAFAGCEYLYSVEIPDLVKTIGDSAFRGCGISYVSIGQSVQTIGNYAFAGCESKSIRIPDSVTHIGDYAFSYVDALVIKLGRGLKTMGVGAFCGSSLSSITIPDGVKKISVSAFLHCSGLTSISFGNGVEDIGDDSFNATGFITLDIPDNVKRIGISTFGNCHQLKSLTLGRGLETIEDGAFESCEDLEEIRCKSLIPPKAYLRSFKSYLITLFVPTEAKRDYESTAPWFNFVDIRGWDFGGVNSIEKGTVNAFVSNNTVVVNGANVGDLLEVYDVAGRLVYSGTDTTISVPTKGIYIVRVAGQTFKVAL